MNAKHLDIDWADLASVYALALKLGKGMTIYKHPDRPNYNITHTSRSDLWGRKGCAVLGTT